MANDSVEEARRLAEERALTIRIRKLCQSLDTSHRTAFTDEDGVTWRIKCPNCRKLASAFRAILSKPSEE